eukprot:Amastigsp_a676462_139.p1 type:complete len:126 gc:universal Amastigsp_a676462_139:735-358(-)
MNAARTSGVLWTCVPNETAGGGTPRVRSKSPAPPGRRGVLPSDARSSNTSVASGAIPRPEPQAPPGRISERERNRANALAGHSRWEPLAPQRFSIAIPWQTALTARTPMRVRSSSSERATRTSGP